MEKRNRVDAEAFHSESLEVISPELVLVDPELAQIARRRLCEPPEWRAPPRAVVAPTCTPAVTRRDVRRSTRVLAAVAAGIPLVLLGAFLVGIVATEVRAQLVDSAAPPVAQSTPDTAVPVDPDDGHWVPTKSEVEARTLVVLRQGVLLSVPAALIDKRTGVLAHDVHVSCRRVGLTAEFGCKVGVGRHPTREWRLDVVGTRDGGEWTWLGPAR